MLIKTGQLAKLAGVLPSKIRFYVQEGLLQPSGTTAGGYCLFDEKGTLSRLRQIATPTNYGKADYRGKSKTKCEQRSTTRKVKRTMGRPYSLELSELAQTYEWAVNCSIQELAEAIQGLRDYPFFSIGSGGSLTAASFWAMVQEKWTGMPSKHGTPLDLVGLPSTRNYAIGLVSARGSNPDIVRAFESASLGESKRLVAITFAEGSKLHVRGKKYPWAQIVNFRPPIARDGFLATNSLLSFMILIYRAYAAAFGSDLDLPSMLPEPRTTGTLSEPPPTTYSILYAGWAAIAAMDVESKLVEAVLQMRTMPTFETSPTVDTTGWRDVVRQRRSWLL